MNDHALATRVLSAQGRVRWFTPREWLRLGGICGVVAALHAFGWGLFLFYSTRHPVLVGLGLTAYLFGLRHAFDADHIAAVDDTIRLMQQNGARPLGVGFFFSLGHSTVVLALTVAIVLATATVTTRLPFLHSYGALLGTGISGAFLGLVGILNLVILVGLVNAWRRSRTGHHDHTHIEELLRKRGLLNRLLGGRARAFIGRSWQMYPLGLLFGLGFDTASEIGLLATAATASVSHLPIAATLSLPILFAAGMTAMDSTDGVLMSQAYQWAFVDPARKLHYNVGMTGLSAFVALGIGGFELLHVLGSSLDLHGAIFVLLAELDPGRLGYALVGLFLAGWGISYFGWKLRHRHDPKPKPAMHAYVHTHPDGVTHIHRHYH